MYIPARFEINDLPTLHAFMERYSFAILVTPIDGVPFATHLPLLLDRNRGPFGTIIGHVARANPHARMGHAVHPSLAIFHGPHAYISPAWYRTENAHVPTWNYTAVHAYGTPTLMDDPAWMEAMLQRLVTTSESRFPNPWSYQPSDTYRRIMQGIIGFEMPIDRLEGKFKLSQNRELEDRSGALAGLESLGEPASTELAAFMRTYLGDP